MRKITRNTLLLLAGIGWVAQVHNIYDVNLDWKQLKCLADNIYHEARGEPYIGQLAVGKVVYNRVASKHYPNTICEVVYQNKQFSWVGKGKVIKDQQAYALAWYAAYRSHDFNLDATHYHATYVDPRWGLRKVKQIGNHIFYK